MRESLVPYRGADRINFLCIFAAEILGEMTLARLPVYASGFSGILDTLRPDARQALLNLRLAGLAPTTPRALSLMVDAYLAHHERLDARRRKGEAPANALPQRYRIAPNLSLIRTWTHLQPDDVAEALVRLTQPLPVRAVTSVPIADPMGYAEIQDVRGYSARLAPLGFVPPAPPIQDLTRRPNPPGFVPWAELVAQANAFDAADIAAGRQADGDMQWFRRLHDETGAEIATLLEAQPGELVTTNGLTLTGLKHLIGLPGSGKTTLLYLLAAWLAARGFRACFLFTSIEVATQFLAVLNQYGVKIGLLYGQGEASRARHALNFAMGLGGQERGFAASHPLAPHFATNCALAGFASDEEQSFPHEQPPCRQVMQRASSSERERRHRCALSSVCGFQHGERALIDADVWAGHVLSLDRKVSPLFASHELHHFEFVARSFDLLVIDECDAAQAALDARGTPVMHLAGETDSLWSALIRDLHQPAAEGRNAFVAGERMYSMMEMSGRFNIAALRLVGRITHLPESIRKAYANKLLTSLSLIADMYPDLREDEEESVRHLDARTGLDRLWDLAVKRVAFRHSLPDPDEEDPDAGNRTRIIADAAVRMAIPTEAAEAYFRVLLEAIEAWDRDGSPSAMETLVTTLRDAPGVLYRETREEAFGACASMLVCVSLVVLQHFGLAPHLHLMHADGLVSDAVFESRPSRDLMSILPETLLGRLSGIRYLVSEDGDVQVAHVSFAGTPRLLPDRIHALSREAGGEGIAVLLTSATSLLGPSPTFHVDTGPHYVLRRRDAGRGWKDSRYVFLPRPDPQNPGQMLRFSGTPITQRDRVLTAMADQLLRGGALSDVANAISQNDVRDGIGRKAAFVVNSYDQCELLFRHIEGQHASWRGRVRYLARANPHGTRHPAAITSAEVELLGRDTEWDLLIFPMYAIGRGVNIVFSDGPRANQALIGSLYFLTRPHPRGESLQLIQGLVGRASARFDTQRFANTDAALARYVAARREALDVAEYLLRIPLMAQRLGPYAEPFVADQTIMILQTIGRAMRGDCPAFVYFVDAAWAQNSARQKADDVRSSMLIQMQSILAGCLDDPDPVRAACYRDLYEAFDGPLTHIENLITQDVKA